MPAIDVVDETFIRAPHERVADAVHDHRRWAGWWPDLRLSIFQDRGRKGIRWNVAGPLEGSMEVWLEEYPTGVILHYYLRVDPRDPRRTGPRDLARIRERRQKSARAAFWALKDELEQEGRYAGQRMPSTPPRRLRHG